MVKCGDSNGFPTHKRAPITVSIHPDFRTSPFVSFSHDGCGLHRTEFKCVMGLAPNPDPNINLLDLLSLRPHANKLHNTFGGDIYDAFIAYRTDLIYIHSFLC